jgi:hypothetical protein
MPEPDTCRRVTRLVPSVLGLRVVPIGLWFLAAPALGPFHGSLSQMAPLGIAVAVVWGIHRWYGARYGRVEAWTVRLERQRALLPGLGAAMLALAAGSAALEPRELILLLVLVLFATAVGLVWPRRVSRALFPIAAVASAAVAGATALLLWGLDPTRLGSLGDLFSLSVGAVLCLAGVVEHLALARVFEELARSRLDALGALGDGRPV